MTNKPAYIVIDTNVLISGGLLAQSQIAQVLEMAVERFTIAQNQATWNELVSRIEKEKFDRYFGESSRMLYLSRLAQFIQTFPENATVRVSRGRRRQVSRAGLGCGCEHPHFRGYGFAGNPHVPGG
jgi:hypothetical protein